LPTSDDRRVTGRDRAAPTVATNPKLDSNLSALLADAGEDVYAVAVTFRAPPSAETVRAAGWSRPRPAARSRRAGSANARSSSSPAATTSSTCSISGRRSRP
jgi:hypothetical protein